MEKKMVLFSLLSIVVIISGMLNDSVISSIDGKINENMLPQNIDSTFYTLNSGKLTVMKDNFVLDGNICLFNLDILSIDLSNRANVTVCNFDLKGSQNGIYLQNSSNCIIAYNNVSFCQDWGGIYLVDSNNNLISNNTVKNCYYGIHLDQESINNSISTNNLLYNQQGIKIGPLSTDNKIFNNVIYENSKYGIASFEFSISASKNMIFENYIANSQCGIVLSLSTNTTISKNVLVGNEVGILIKGSSNNNLEQNVFENNSKDLEFEKYETRYGEEIFPENNLINNKVL